jgi:hypothetical protein
MAAVYPGIPFPLREDAFMNSTGLFQPCRWCLMATFQVAEGAPDLADILADLDFGFRLEAAASSPPGYRWLNLYVDARRGPRRCGLTAHRLLSGLTHLAEAGDVPGFRVIAGEHWLEYPVSPDTLTSSEEASEGADLTRH